MRLNSVVWECHKNKGLPVVVVYPGAVLVCRRSKAREIIFGHSYGTMPAKVLKKLSAYLGLFKRCGRSHCKGIGKGLTKSERNT